MDDEHEDTTLSATQDAEAKKGKCVDGGVGKFKNVDELYRAYERLQAEFTRRSQRLKALEAGLATSDEKTRESVSGQVASVGNALPPSGEKTAATTYEDGRKQAYNTENKPNAVFSETYANATQPSNKYVSAKFCRGSAVGVPPLRPRTLAEAGELAKEYIK